MAAFPPGSRRWFTGKRNGSSSDVICIIGDSIRVLPGLSDSEIPPIRLYTGGLLATKYNKLKKIASDRNLKIAAILILCPC